MATTAGPGKTISIYDYPEHLNPFREDDNHNKIRFWTIGRKLNRSNSITFSGIKDLKNSWAFRSFMKKGKKNHASSAPPEQEYNKPSHTVKQNGESSPIIFRRAIQYSSMSEKRGHMSTPERYVYGGSVTPLPRSRFQERLRSTSQYDVESMSMTPRMARSEVSGSRLSVESTNPFDEPEPPVRMPRRKKKKAPPPPPQRNMDVSVTSVTSETIVEDTSTNTQTTLNETADDIDIEMAKLNIELKIIEDEDSNIRESNNNNDSPKKVKSPDRTPPNTPQNEKVEVEIGTTTKENKTLNIENGNSEDSIDEDEVSFPKVNIERYRRNSSVNKDDIRLRRGNLEDFQPLTYKRSKSLTNTFNSHHVIYDINLNEDIKHDNNGNNEPQKVICKVYEDTGRKESIDISISSTERELNEIDEATRQLQREISKLNSALNEDDVVVANGNHKDNGDIDAPNPIPKPRRSHYGDKANILKN